jgi:hypothetical protein
MAILLSGHPLSQQRFYYFEEVALGIDVLTEDLANGGSGSLARLHGTQCCHEEGRPASRRSNRRAAAAQAPASRPEAAFAFWSGAGSDSRGAVLLPLPARTGSVTSQSESAVFYLLWA